MKYNADILSSFSTWVSSEWTESISNPCNARLSYTKDIHKMYICMMSNAYSQTYRNMLQSNNILLFTSYTLAGHMYYPASLLQCYSTPYIFVTKLHNHNRDDQLCCKSLWFTVDLLSHPFLRWTALTRSTNYFALILMAHGWCYTAVSPVHRWWGYNSLTLSHRYCQPSLIPVKYKSSLTESKSLPISQNQYYGCWWPGDVRSQVISKHDIDLR